MNKINNTIEDYCSAIRIYSDDDRVYLQRGNLYQDLGKYEEAIADCTRAIKVNSINASAYVNRGIPKQNSGLSFYSDYKKACDLGKERCCQWYNNECR